MSKSDVNGYDLSKDWFMYMAENTNVKPMHTALYFFIINKWNSLFWKKNFGLATDNTMQSLNIRSYKTYISTLNDLVAFGAIIMIEKSKNQHTSNIIEVVKNTKANTKADTEANTKALLKHEPTQVQSNVSIIKQLNYKTIKLLKKEDFDFLISSNEFKNYLKESKLRIESSKEKEIFNFRKSFLNLGVEKQILDDWLKVRKTKKGANTETAYNSILKQINLSGLTANECIKKAAEKSWCGFQAEWLENAKSNGQAEKYKIDKSIKDNPNRLSFD